MDVEFALLRLALRRIFESGIGTDVTTGTPYSDKQYRRNAMHGLLDIAFDRRGMIGCQRLGHMTFSG